MYHALIDTLGAHGIHVNLNTIFCTQVEHKSEEEGEGAKKTETECKTRKTAGKSNNKRR